MRRTVIAFILAPLAPLAAWAIYNVLAGPSSVTLGNTLSLAIFYGYPQALLFGLPAYFAFRRKGWLNWWQITLAGTTIGSVLPILMLTFGLPNFELLVVGSACGALSGFAFWLIAESRIMALTNQSRADA